MNNSYTVELKYLIYRSFVKYDILQRLVYETFGNSSIASTTELNIYVDLYSICKPIFSESNRTIIEDYTELTTELINLCAHYRSFFKKLSVRTKFYLVWSKNICDINRKLVPGYNEVFFNKSKIKIFDDFINNNLDLLEIIVPYLPDIFFIRSIKNYESSVIISSLIDTVSGGIPNLIISNDTYPLQLTAIHPNTCLLVPIKYLQEDDSFMVPINEKNNFREKFWGVLNKINEHKSESTILQTISPINFPLFFSLIGMKKGMSKCYLI